MSKIAEAQVFGGCNAWCYDPRDCVDGCKQQAMREAKDAVQAAIVRDAKRYRELNAQPQQERTEPSEALRNAFKAHYGDERGRTADANRAFDEFAAGWQAALAAYCITKERT